MDVQIDVLIPIFFRYEYVSTALFQLIINTCPIVLYLNSEIHAKCFLQRHLVIIVQNEFKTLCNFRLPLSQVIEVRLFEEQ